MQACDSCGGDVTMMSELLEVSRRGLQLRMRELDVVWDDDAPRRG
jgi:hypothetical protein